MEVLHPERIFTELALLFFMEIVVLHIRSYAVVFGKLVVLFRAVAGIGNALRRAGSIQALMLFSNVPYISYFSIA